MNENNQIIIEEIEKLKEKIEERQTKSDILEEKISYLKEKIDEIITNFNQSFAQLSNIIPDIDRRLAILEAKECECKRKHEDEECECEKESE